MLDCCSENGAFKVNDDGGLRDTGDGVHDDVVEDSPIGPITNHRCDYTVVPFER